MYATIWGKEEQNRPRLCIMRTTGGHMKNTPPGSPAGCFYCDQRKEADVLSNMRI